VADGAAGLEDLDYMFALASCVRSQQECARWAHTPHEDVQDQNNEADDAAAGAVLRGV